MLACAHGLLPLDRRNTILTVDRDGNGDLIDAARAAGVGHVVLMSVSMASPSAPYAFARAKAAAEEQLRGSGLPATVVRATAFMESHVIWMFGEPLRSTGKVRVFGRGQTKINFVAADDVADVVARAIADGPEDGFRALGIGGPEEMTRMQSIDLLEGALGVKARRTHVPVPMMRALKVVARPLNPSLGYLVEAALMEETHPELFGYAPGERRLVGSTRLENVVEAWAGGPS